MFSDEVSNRKKGGFASGIQLILVPRKASCCWLSEQFSAQKDTCNCTLKDKFSLIKYVKEFLILKTNSQK